MILMVKSEDDYVKKRIDSVLNGYVDASDTESVYESKKSRLGKEILDRILEEDEDLGGVYSETTGSQGSGKTSTNLAFCLEYMTRYPQDRCFWSSTYNAPLQFVKLGLDRVHFMVLEGSGVQFKDRKRYGIDVDVDVTYFKDFDELWEKSIPGKCNAVFFGDRKIWRQFIKYLRRQYDWAHVFFDEFGEVASSEMKGNEWLKIRDFAEDIKEIRKCNKNIHTNTQAVSDIDYRVRRKLMIRIFLPGAKADSKSTVYQKAINNLKVDREKGNMAYVDYDGKFGVTRFRNVFKPLKDMSWEARVMGDDDIAKIKTG